ncbi:MAG: high-potential iron-sulfur protein, partial [Haloarculaceae archaeon]
YIDGADWCTIYETLPEPDVPEGMSEAELATAEVPEEYRTASSQVGEERDPEDLLSQEEVNLMESVEAVEEEVAPPGQSCGTCAEFIPDKNGDTWGACARVEGYIAAEDWCAVWEHVSEEL